MRTPRPAWTKCSLVTSAQPRRQCRRYRLSFQLRFFGPESGGRQRAGGQQDVGVGVVRIVEVDAEVRDHALGDEFALDEVAEQRDLFGAGELDGQADFDLARDLGILALLRGLDRVPQALAVEYPVGCAIGREDFGVLDAALAAVVVGDAGSLFVEQRSRAVGRGGDGALAFGPLHDLCAQMINRHLFHP